MSATLARVRRPLGSRLAAAAILGLLASCGRSDEGRESPMPGDSLESIPASEPVAAPSQREAGARPADRGADAAQAGAPDAGSSAACLVDTLDPGRLDVDARWEDGHVRVSGVVRAGAGNTLNVRLAHGDAFVYDEVFRGERIGAVALTSDGVDLLSESYSPDAAELEAFRRVGAVPRDPARSLCLDLSLYELDTLDRLASRQIPLFPSP